MSCAKHHLTPLSYQPNEITSSNSPRSSAAPEPPRKRSRRHSTTKSASLSPSSLALAVVTTTPLSSRKWATPNIASLAGCTSPNQQGEGDLSRSSDSISLSSGGGCDSLNNQTNSPRSNLDSPCRRINESQSIVFVPHRLKSSAENPVSTTEAATYNNSITTPARGFVTFPRHGGASGGIILPPPAASLADSLETPPVLSLGDQQRLTLLTPMRTLAATTSPGSLVTPGANIGASGANNQWPPQGAMTSHDFETINAAFDASLSGLSDLAGNSAYVNDMIDFARRQSSQNATGVDLNPSPSSPNSESFFQYILMAATSSAVRIHEEPLTYLNQGQSYEIKCKRLTSPDSNVPPSIYKSIVRIGFHDRRQKFQEKELLRQWKQLHHSSKIIDADVPMSINVFNITTDNFTSQVEFMWDSSKNTSLFVKINCISTEFTAHKHGGEKGVPFRLQIDTYPATQHPMMMGDAKHLHSAYAQIKVFKTKGADRKIKTDRERIERRNDKDKFQPSYEYTILIETFPSADPTIECDLQSPIVQLQQNQVKLEHQQQQQQLPTSSSSGSIVQSVNNNTGNNSVLVIGCSSEPRYSTPNQNTVNQNGSTVNVGQDAESVVSSQAGTNSPSLSNDERFGQDLLIPESTPFETNDWLRRQRFSAQAKLLQGYSGTDLLRLSRDDLMQICGTADGIRLYNAVQSKRIQPKLTLYMCVPGAPAYHAVFLKALTLAELVRKVCSLIQVQPGQIYDVYCQGPDMINIHVNDEVVQNMIDRSRFTIDAMKCGEESECYRILLKATGGES